jgi:hypothetical protein
MGKITEPRPVKLIVGLFTGNMDLLPSARVALVERFGEIDYESERLPFHHTHYYEAEFGPNLQRQILSFAKLVPPEQLTAVKRLTNELEQSWSVDGQRRVNLDPGYVSLSKLVLATTKDYSHRVYLGQGIYAEVTLHYRRGSFRSWEWTYPDYASERYREIFDHIRSIYVAQLRQRD